jgi:tripartite-type tricarboxylate transporter receptor subunit TctC
MTAAAALPWPVAAQDLPAKKTITIVVGFAAGGAADTAARIIGKKLADNTGLTVVIDNKPGAGGNIAHQYVATGPSDGSVLLFGSVGPLAIAPHLMKVAYDPVRDLAPITMGVNFPNVLVVHAGLQIKTFAEFIDHARKNPGKLDYASTGAGSASHLAGELLNDMAKIDTLHVPYKGGAPALQDLLGGRVAAYYSTYSTAQPHIESGKLIPLASTGPRRLPQLPNIPTIAESGYPGYSASNWYAFVASSKVPKPILDRWNTELVKVLKSPDVAVELVKHGLPPQPGSRDELAAEIASESAMWGRVIRDRKITME